MPSHSPLLITYIIFQSISLTLLAFLMITILKSKSYFAKWTLFQICVCAFCLGLTYLLTITIYGDDLTTFSTNPPLFCIIQSEISQLFFYPLQIFPAMLSVYLWFAIVKLDIKIEQRFFWWLTGFTWGLTILRSLIFWVVESDYDNSGVTTNKFFCIQVDSERAWLSYLIPTTILTLLSLIIAVHSGIILWDRWIHFSNRQNRRTAIKFGQSLRLAVYGCFYVTTLLISLLPSLMRKFHGDMSTSIGWSISDYSSSLIGIVLFLIFGTTKSAAIFLPCYYVSPDDQQFRTMKTNYLESNMNAYQLETVTTNQQQQEQGLEQQSTTDSSSPISLSLSLSQRKRELAGETSIIVPDSPIGGSSLRTVSSQKPMLEALPSPISPRFSKIPHLPSLTTSDGSRDQYQCEEYDDEYMQFESFS